MSRSPRSNHHSPHARHSRSPSPAHSRQPSPRRDRFMDDEGARNPGNQIYIGGLGVNTTKEDLEARFSKYGPLEECSVVTDPHRNECRGFGFVRYSDKEHAVQAIAAEHGTLLGDRTLIVQHSKRNCERPKTPGQYLGQRALGNDYRYRDRSPGRRSRDMSPYGGGYRGRHRDRPYHDDYDRRGGASDRDRDRDRDGDSHRDSHHRDSYRYNYRGSDRDRERDRDRDRDRMRDSYRDRSRDRDRDRDRDRSRDRRSSRY